MTSIIRRRSQPWQKNICGKEINKKLVKTRIYREFLWNERYEPSNWTAEVYYTKKNSFSYFVGFQSDVGDIQLKMMNNE